MKILVQVFWCIYMYAFLKEEQQPSNIWGENTSNPRKYEEGKIITIFYLSELPLEPSSTGKTSPCGNAEQLQAHSVLPTAASFGVHLIALTTEQQGSTPAPAPSMQSTSQCCPHPHPFHGQTDTRKEKKDSLHYIKVLNFSVKRHF